MFCKILKKIYFLFLFIFLVTFSFSENNILNNITYKKGEIVLTFKNAIASSKYSTSYDSSTYLLKLDFKDLNINKKVIKSSLNINDEFIDTIIIDEINSKTSFYLYAQTNIEYSISNKSSKELVIKVKKQDKKLVKRTIVLDAGHGGKDSGAVGNNLMEKDLALSTILKLRDILKDEYNVILTRDSDFFVTLSDRAKISNNNNADLFISIHLNAASNNTANGAEVFYFTKNPTTYANEISKFENSFDEKSTLAIESSKFLLDDISYHANQVISSALAKDVLDNMISTIQPLRRRGIFGANFAVLRGTTAPSILIELGFITNKSDSDLFSNEQIQIRAAEAIAKAVRKHFN